ncbi:peptidyl-tRNA hydrolase [Roseibium hamelinense]|uniref:Peptidyl-tRNA hydrolase n=1 Tax=Roseibium hamelinense TaxID=150831 RepID=A0A562SXR8_9HYPH|nr:aminoacyl-tRNA hydrolase [Roseibium hamelinense]MTI43622.1 aminoacyl-tRNA hydrolase [Roseibium hamelinense]TWI86139.1 peptidyl-tRNA hydrolase [Roseibium hamelinense]
MRLIVGLGNPGAKYERNRHNIGFLAVDEIHRQSSSFAPWRARFQGQVSEGLLGSEKVLLLKPSTFMNESGRAVGEAIRFYKLQPDDVVVIYDELDLPPAKFRMKKGGGHGGHNGLRSITAHIGENYRRLRLGIGHPGEKRLVSNYVLGDFAKADREWLEPLLDEIARHADLLAAGKDSQFSNKLTLALDPEKAKRPARTSTETKSAPSGKPGPKGQSHIRQARQTKTAELPKKGPMAEMLKKLLGNKDAT